MFINLGKIINLENSAKNVKFMDLETSLQNFEKHKIEKVSQNKKNNMNLEKGPKLKKS